MMSGLFFNNERGNMKALILAALLATTPAFATNGGGHDFGIHNDCNHEGGGKHEKGKHDWDSKDKSDHPKPPKPAPSPAPTPAPRPEPAPNTGGQGSSVGPSRNDATSNSQAQGGAVSGSGNSQSSGTGVGFGGNATGGAGGQGGAGGNVSSALNTSAMGGAGGTGGGATAMGGAVGNVGNTEAYGGNFGDVGGSGSGNSTNVNTSNNTLFIPSHTQPATSTTVPSATLTRTVDNSGCGVRQQIVRTPIYATISGFWRDKQVQNGENFELVMATDAAGNLEPWKTINGEKFGHQVILDGAVLSQSSITGLSIGGNRGSGGGGSGSSNGGDALQQLASRIILRDCPVTQAVKIETREVVREVVLEVPAKPAKLPKKKFGNKNKGCKCRASLKLSNFIKGV